MNIGFGLRRRERFLYLVGILVAISAVVMGISMFVLFRASIESKKHDLVEMVKSHARVIEGVAEHERSTSQGSDPVSHEHTPATQRVLDSLSKGSGFGATGEFVIAQREGDRIVFLSTPRHLDHPIVPMPIGAEEAELMRRALAGEGGTIRGLDYRGVEVLAAFEPLPSLKMGIVAKLDMTEIRAPFLTAAAVAGAIGILIIALGVLVFRRIGVESVLRAAGGVSAAPVVGPPGSEQGIPAGHLAVLIGLALTIFALDLVTPLGIAGGVPFVALILAGWWLPRRSDIYVLAAAASILTGLGYAFSPVAGDPVVVLINRTYALFVIWLTAIIVSIAKASEIAVRDRDERVRSIVETVIDGIVTIDTSGSIESFNPEAERLFGYGADEVIGRNVGMLMPEPYRRNHDSYVRNYLKTGKANVIGLGREAVALRKDGSEFPIELAVSEMAVGGRRKFTGVVRDITERKQAEAQLKESRDELEVQADQLQEMAHTSERERLRAEEATEAKSRFLANMSHELRTPLNAIIGYSEMLLEDAEEAGDKNYLPDLGKINTAGRHLLELIADILDISKIEAGRMEIFAEPFSVAGLVGEAVDTVQHLAEATDNRLKTDCPADIGDMHSDLTKTRQILLNLLGNATKFTEGGTISLIVRRFTDSDRDWIEFKVKDTGIGISDEQREILFADFVQANSSSTRAHVGTGLGLAISKRFCQLMGGEIGIESEVGVGSTFTVTLPARMTEKRPTGGAAETNAVSEQNAWAEEFVASRKSGEPLALVIDDDDDARNLVAGHLKRRGYAVHSTGDGDSGIELAAVHRPTVITLDVNMPGTDGWTVMERLKENPETVDIPVIFITISDDRKKGFALGAAEFLKKPIDRNKLVEVLNNCLGHHRGGEILVVEDDKFVRDFLTVSLRDMGWILRAVEDGLSALDSVENKAPDVIILDLMLPRMDGFEFVDRLRENDAWRNIAIIVLTAKSLTAEEHRRINGIVENVMLKSLVSMADVTRQIDLIAGRLIATGREGER